MALVVIHFSFHVHQNQTYSKNKDLIAYGLDAQFVWHRVLVQSLLKFYILMALLVLLHPCKLCNVQGKISESL